MFPLLVFHAEDVVEVSPATAGMPAEWSETSVMLVMSQTQTVMICNTEHQHTSQHIQIIAKLQTHKLLESVG